MERVFDRAGKIGAAAPCSVMLTAFSRGSIDSPLGQMEDGSHMTEKIWRLTLKIVCLLSGETFPPVKSGDHVTMTVAPPPSWSPERLALQKILEIANKMTELLMGEAWIEEAELLLEDSDLSEVGRDLYQDIEEESSGQVTSERSPLDECGDGAAEEETGVSSDEQCMKEESSPVIGAVGQHTGRNSSTPLNIPPHYRKEDDHMVDSSEGLPITRDHHDEDLSGNWMDVPDDSHHVGYHTTQRQRLVSPYSCLECGKCFPFRSLLLIHERVHTGEKPYSCSECVKCFSSKTSLTKHERVHTGEKPYSCAECGKCFADKSSLNTHKRVHTGEKLYSCSECGKTFTQKSSLLRHENIHTGGKVYSCCDCGKCFSQRSALNTHGSLHRGEKPYSCSECGKRFSQKSAQIKHVRYHTGEKPYSCSECGKNFVDKSDLNGHKRIHTGEKPFSCSECGKCYSQKSNLQKHERVHTGEKPYSCSECGKCFSLKGALIKHRRVHTGEKPYSCCDCGKCFSQKGDLKKHRRVHTGEKPYFCSKCGKYFSQQSNLLKHEKTLHAKEEPRC